MKLQDFDFRLWDNKSKEYNGNREVVLSSENVIYRIHTITGELEKLKSDFLEIELWSGLRDKNDKKIFEGDIIKNIDLKAEYRVVYQGEFLLFPIKYESKIPLQKELAIRFCVLASEASEILDSFEIIGNIHDEEVR